MVMHRWNIFHILCFVGHLELLNHLLRRLPREITEGLLVRQSKDLQNTVSTHYHNVVNITHFYVVDVQPLHIAVRKGRKQLVTSLLEFSKKCGLHVRNVDGSTPLHLAVQRGFVEITRLLVEASPTECLHAENGVGETPLEMATLQELLWRTRTEYITSANTPLTLDINGDSRTQKYFDLAKQEVEIPKLRATLNQLLDDGRLKKGTKTTTELLAFAVAMEAKLATARTKPVPEIIPKKEEIVSDKTDWKGTLEHMRKAVTARPGLRNLVHLIDVQKSVDGDLRRVNKGKKRNPIRSDDDGFQPEEDVVEEQKRKSMIINHVSFDADGW